MSVLPKCKEEGSHVVMHEPGVEDRPAVVSRVELFMGLRSNEAAMQELARRMEERIYRSGDVLISEGASGEDYFILCDGEVSIYKNTPEGDPFKVALLRGASAPGFGEGALVASEARSATVVCDTPCRCLVLSRQAFVDFTEAHSQWALPIYRQIASTLLRRLHRMNHDLILLHKALTDEIRGSGGGDDLI